MRRQGLTDGTAADIIVGMKTQKVDKAALAAAKTLGEKSSSFLIFIIVFAVIWGGALAAGFIFYARLQGLMLLVLIVAAIMLAVTAYVAASYFITPAKPVKRDETTLYMFCGFGWRSLPLDQVDEVRTNLQPLRPYTSLATLTDRGTMRIFDKMSNLYRVRFLDDPAGVKARIDELKASRICIGCTKEL